MSNDRWQFEFVSIYGPTTERAVGFGEGIPLKVENGNIPIGSYENSTISPLLVSAPYLKISFGIPKSTTRYASTGKIKIFRKSREFSRDILDIDNGLVVEVGSFDVPALLGTTKWNALDRDTYIEDLVFLDQTMGASGVTWYYTIFYEVVLLQEAGFPFKWCFSPSASHERNFTYKNEIKNGIPWSRHGSVMFNLLPDGWKDIDYAEGNDTIYRLLQIYGRSFDTFREDLEKHLVSWMDIDNVDAGMIPYIDWLLGWPTNYELPEIARRRETRQVATLWKSKGTIDAMQLVLQTITGWKVELVEGWKSVLNTATKTLKDPNTPPVLWNEPTDGVWDVLVDGVPRQTTVNNTNPKYTKRRGSNKDLMTYTPSTEKINDFGVGTSWQNNNGLLIILSEVAGVSKALPTTVIRKVHRISPLFAAHYTSFALMIETTDSETFGSISREADIYRTETLSQRQEDVTVGVSSNIQEMTGDICVMYSYPHPEYPLDSNTATIINQRFWTPHSYTVFSCDPFMVVDEFMNNIVDEFGNTLVG